MRRLLSAAATVSLLFDGNSRPRQGRRFLRYCTLQFVRIESESLQRSDGEITAFNIHKGGGKLQDSGKLKGSGGLDKKK